MTELTVIMPVYNAERYLSAAIDSVLKQTYQHFLKFMRSDSDIIWNIAFPDWMRFKMIF